MPKDREFIDSSAARGKAKEIKEEPELPPNTLRCKYTGTHYLLYTIKTKGKRIKIKQSTMEALAQWILQDK